MVTGGRVTIPDWPRRRPRPATRSATCWPRMGATVELTADGLTVTGGGAIAGIEADLSDAGELAPTLAALAALADPPSRLQRRRPPARARDRPARGAGRRDQRAGRRRHRDGGRPGHRAPPAARRAPSTPTATTAWPPPRRSSACGCPASRSRTSRPPAKTIPEFAAPMGRHARRRRKPGRPPRDPQAPPPRRGRRPRPSRTRQVPPPLEGPTRARGGPVRHRHDRRPRALHGRARRRDRACTRSRPASSAARASWSATTSTSSATSPATPTRRAASSAGDERSSTLRRTADDSDPVERVVVANANQLAVVTATVDPAPRTGLIDRAIVAALDAGIEPMLVVTKTDLKPPDELLALYGPLDLPLFTITGQAGARRASRGRWPARPRSSSGTRASASRRS